MRLFTFAASHRKDSINRKLVKLALSFTKDAHIDFAEYGTFDMPIYDDEMFDGKSLPAAAQKFISHLEKADGIILSSPEYNWSFPGSLKNIIDWVSVVSPNPFKGKTALLLSASPSLRGGLQGLIQLKVPLEHLGVLVFPHVFTLSRAEGAFDVEGNFKDVKLTAELQQLMAEFSALTTTLKTAQ